MKRQTCILALLVLLQLGEKTNGKHVEPGPPSVSKVNNRPGEVNCESTGEVCVDDCTGREGPHQSCRNCTWYVMCTFETVVYMPCSEGTQFDATTRKCEFQSLTCEECYIYKTTQQPVVTTIGATTHEEVTTQQPVVTTIGATTHEEVTTKKSEASTTVVYGGNIQA